MPSVATVPFRTVRNNPQELDDKLRQNRFVLISKRGDAYAVMFRIQDDIMAAIRLLSQVQAQMAVSRMRERAKELGLDRLAEEEIQAEVDAVRRETLRSE